MNFYTSEITKPIDMEKYSNPKVLNVGYEKLPEIEIWELKAC